MNGTLFEQLEKAKGDVAMLLALANKMELYLVDGYVGEDASCHVGITDMYHCERCCEILVARQLRHQLEAIRDHINKGVV